MSALKQTSKKKFTLDLTKSKKFLIKKACISWSIWKL